MTDTTRIEAAALEEAVEKLSGEGKEAFHAMVKEYPETAVDVQIAMATLMAGVAKQGAEIERCHAMLDGVAKALRPQVN